MKLNLDGGGKWGTCNDNLLIKSLYREPGSGAGLGSIDNCKCLSPTPSSPFEDCYEQTTALSFD